MSEYEMEKFEESLKDNIYSKQFKRSVNRNISRFPEEFMLVLNEAEFNSIQNLRCQIGTSSWGGVRYSPYVFTEQGVDMLAGVLKSATHRCINKVMSIIFLKKSTCDLLDVSL